MAACPMLSTAPRPTEGMGAGAAIALARAALRSSALGPLGPQPSQPASESARAKVDAKERAETTERMRPREACCGDRRTASLAHSTVPPAPCLTHLFPVAIENNAW